MRAPRWWRAWRASVDFRRRSRPAPFRCFFCGDRVQVKRRGAPPLIVVDLWNCPTCKAGGWGDGDTWYTDG